MSGEYGRGEKGWGAISILRRGGRSSLGRLYGELE